MEEVVDMRGGWADQTYGNDLHCLWLGKVRPKKKGHSQLRIATHLTSYAFIADKLHKIPI